MHVCHMHPYIWHQKIDAGLTVGCDKPEQSLHCSLNHQELEDLVYCAKHKAGSNMAHLSEPSN